HLSGIGGWSYAGTPRPNWHPGIETRMGIYYLTRNVSVMDRGMVPEYKQYAVTEVRVPCEWSEADKAEASIRYEAIPRDAPDYQDLWEAAERGSDPSLMLRNGRTLVRCQPMLTKKVRGQVVRVGWRHTFEKFVAAGIPGITRATLSARFGIDMWKYPV